MGFRFISALSDGDSYGYLFWSLARLLIHSGLSWPGKFLVLVFLFSFLISCVFFLSLHKGLGARGLGQELDGSGSE